MPEFTTTLTPFGPSVGIEVPEDIVLGFGVGRRVPVVVRLNGFEYRSTIAPMDGKYLVPVAAAVRASAGVAGGETHVVSLELDQASRAVEAPPELQEALEAAGLTAAWSALAPSRQKEHARSISEAVAADTRARRIAKVVAQLGGGS